MLRVCDAKDEPMSSWRKQQVDSKMRDIGSRLRSIREGRGLSQEELSRLSHVDQATLSQIESNGKRLTLPSLLRISMAMKLELSIVLGGM